MSLDFFFVRFFEFDKKKFLINVWKFNNNFVLTNFIYNLSLSKTEAISFASYDFKILIEKKTVTSDRIGEHDF